MHLSLKLGGALVASAIALALSASTALAAHGTAVEITNEATGQHCSLPLLNCKIVVHNTDGGTELVGHLFGIESTDSICNVEHTGYAGEDGTGHIVDHVLTGPDCTRQPCSGVEAEWPTHHAETGAGQEVTEVEWCLEPKGGGDQIHCTVQIVVSGFNHNSAEASATDQACESQSGTSARVELTGHWTTEDAESDDIEVIHL